MSSLSEMIKKDDSQAAKNAKAPDSKSEVENEKIYYVVSHRFTFKLKGKTYSPDPHGRYNVPKSAIEDFEFYKQQGYVTDEAPKQPEEQAKE